MNGLEAAPWVDRSLRAIWPQLREMVGRQDLPQLATEFGRGHYGSVMPTLKPGDNRVVKLTSDITEGLFVGHILDGDLQPEDGLVHYDRIIGIPGSYYGRPLFLIWRQEAFKLGFLMYLHTGLIESGAIEDWRMRAYEEGSIYHEIFLDAARDFQAKISDVLLRQTGSRLAYGKDRAEVYAPIWAGWEARRWHIDIDWSRERWPRPRVSQALRILRRYRGFDRLMVALDICHQAADMLANTDQWYPIGAAFNSLLDEGFLLADVHNNNIGLDADSYKGHMLITDPGHAVPFNPALADAPNMIVLKK